MRKLRFAVMFTYVMAIAVAHAIIQEIIKEEE